ncbi:MAG TPA: type II toxin-antitoxin system RelE/ParE family toxin [Desulfosporosinus sp.]|nr:type II toxin-antitoxin system RelE/ParE family toxin [Desulfosporosinus sp.]
MVIWSDPSKQDLRQIYEFIAKDSTFYAQKVVSAIVEKSETLNIFPYMGRIVPERNEERIRELLIYSYRMIYQINLENIEILTLVHSKKDFL